MDDYPNARDCEHGRQRGKCADCDLVAAEKTLAAADRLAEAVGRYAVSSSGGDDVWLPVSEALAAYLTERGR